MHAAVFLDRDGVLNKGYVRDGKSYAPRSVNDFKLLPYAARSVERLKKQGYLVIVVTNQPDINNGLASAEEVAAMHSLLKKKTNVDDIYMCQHSRNENCDCRKPRPGMLLAAAKKYHINLKKSFMVGDRASDIDAGLEAGCRTIFLNRHYKEPQPEKQEKTFLSINAATNYIIYQTITLQKSKSQSNAKR